MSPTLGPPGCIMEPAVSFQIMCREIIITGERSIFLEVTVSVTIKAEFT